MGLSASKPDDTTTAWRARPTATGCSPNAVSSGSARDLRGGERESRQRAAQTGSRSAGGQGLAIALDRTAGRAPAQTLSIMWVAEARSAMPTRIDILRLRLP